jgi:drug/metabolite transporter (DMT)-like permease
MNSTMQRNRWWMIVLVIVGAASYGLLSPFVKIAYEQGWGDGEISISQVTMGALLLWVIVLVRPASWSNPFRGPWIRLSLAGILGLTLTTVFYNMTLAELDASLAIVLLFQFTWITILMDSIAAKRLPTRFQLAAIVLVLAGTALAVNVFSADLSRFGWRGVLYGMCAAVTYSVFLFWTGRIRSSMHPLLKTAVMLTASVPAIFVIYPPSALLGPGHGSLLLWGLLLGLLCQVIPTICFNIGIPGIGSSLAAMLAAVELPVAVAGAYLILGESVLLVQWMGMLLIFAGIAISEKRSAARQ